MRFTVRRRTLSAIPQTVDLRLYAGDAFGMTLTVTEPDGSPASFDGDHVWAQVRARPDSDEVLGEFDIARDQNVLLLRLSGGITAALPHRCTYDCEWRERALTLIAGSITVMPQVTRNDTDS